MAIAGGEVYPRPLHSNLARGHLAEEPEPLALLPLALCLLLALLTPVPVSEVDLCSLLSSWGILARMCRIAREGSAATGGLLPLPCPLLLGLCSLSR